MNNIIDTGIMKEIVINNNKYKSTSIVQYLQISFSAEKIYFVYNLYKYICAYANV